MEPIDRRTTAATLLGLLGQPDAARAIAELLGVPRMEFMDATLTTQEITHFVETRDATLASQLIHVAQVRRQRREPKP